MKYKLAVKWIKCCHIENSLLITPTTVSDKMDSMVMLLKIGAK